jgi:hypothetical protein
MTTEFKFTYETILPNDRLLLEQQSGPAIWQLLTQDQWSNLPWITMQYLLPIGTEFTLEVLNTMNIEVNMINEWAINHHQPYRNVQFWSREQPLPNTEWSITVLPTALHVPGQPTAPIATAGVNEVFVSTTAPDDGGSPITDYIWQVSVAPYDVWNYMDDGATMNVPEAILRGPSVVTGVTGKVRVCALNSIGMSVFSEPSEEVTVLGIVMKEPSDPGQPIVTAGIDSVFATIEAPDDGGSPITDYIWYVGTAPSYHIWVPFDSLNTELSATLPLAGGVTGRVRVAAVNSVGSSQPGDFSEEVTALQANTGNIPSAPNAPTVEAGINSILATIEAPDDGGSPITDYIWYLGIAPLYSDWTPFDSLNTELTMTLPLDAGQTGRVRVAAVNVIGTSEFSDFSEEITGLLAPQLPGIPSAPVVIAGIESVTATTTAPDDGGSPITDYLWQYSIGDFTEWFDYGDVVSNSTEIIFAGMTGGTTGKIRVAAVNVNGTSEFSEPSEEVTVLSAPVLTIPNVPIAPIAIPGDPGAILVTVTAPDDGGSSIIDYVWQVSVAPYDVWTDFADDINPIPTTTLSGFGSGVTGKVRVSAINGVGQSGFSDPSEEVTTV